MANERRRLLIVDDEEIVINSLKALISLETPHDVLAFTSCRAALESIRRKPVELAISDFLMPEMDGVTFLKEVRALYPEAPLLILTGYADKESAIRAINEVGLYQYLEKPWDNDDLLHVIEGGLSQRMLIHRLQEYARELEAKVQQLEREVERLKARG